MSWYTWLLLTWQKSNLFLPWYTWHTAHLAKKLLILTMIYLTPCSPGKKVTYSHHDIPDTLLTWQKSNLFLLPDTLLTWQKSTYSAMIYLTSCSPGKTYSANITYWQKSNHDIPDTLLTWQKSNFFAWQVYHGRIIPEQGVLLTWQKSYLFWPGDIPDLFSPWYTWHPAHLAKK